MTGEDLPVTTSSTQMMKWCVALVSLVVAGSHGVGAANEDKIEAAAAQQARAKRDYPALIDSLASKNDAPSMRKGRRGSEFPNLPNDNDWSEPPRIQKVVNTLTADVEHAWPQLVESMTDERYCATLWRQIEVTSCFNVSVGDVCRNIVRHRLRVGLPAVGEIVGRYESFRASSSLPFVPIKRVQEMLPARDDLQEWWVVVRFQPQSNGNEKKQAAESSATS